MASLIPGYEYDIFISYRQKDNKGDRWVSEFVEALKTELESTFKEEISVYFDINPHDGLLETHDVDESLKEKLKCLIFIPILSRTYCDPKSFAWEHEFKAFVQLASQDQYGLKVKLPNGNVASRVLPVRIYDLSDDDTKLCESVLGGVLRGVAFVYKSSGINRPLILKEENPHENLNHTNYRDQINKLAIAIDEILNGLKKENTRLEGKKELFIEPQVEIKANKKREKRREKKDQIQKVKNSLSKYSLLFILVVSVLLLVIFGVRIYSRQKKTTWAKNIQIPAIKKIINESSSVPVKAFEMASEVAKIIPEDSDLIRLWPLISDTISIDTYPSSAEVFWKSYENPDSKWSYLGLTPLEKVRIPKNFLRFKIQKEGFDSVLYAGVPGTPWPLPEKIRLDSTHFLPVNMVRIPSGNASNTIAGLEKYIHKKVGEFIMDRYEVTNKEFKVFTDSGGYTERKYWKYPILTEGREIPWEKAMIGLLDKTGRPGPSTWEVGTYPEGTENHPVSGVSWYEAAAYAEFVNKRLPTVCQWDLVVQTNQAMNIIRLSNYNGVSSTTVGNTKGFSSYGIYDLAGNVREWCLNEGNYPWQHYNLGGGWNDPTYFFNFSVTQDAMDRSISNGFRCVKILPGDTIIAELSEKIPFEFRDYRKEKPVDDRLFEFFSRQYLYDKTPLNPEVEVLKENNSERIEKVTVDAAYNKERLIIYIFLPADFKGPYQPIIYYPGSGAIMTKDAFSEVTYLNFFIKSGRAVVLPVYKSTYERVDELKSTSPDESVLYKEHVIMWRKDLGRTIDYLETRKDMLSDKIGYVGYSWGGRMGGILPAVETRIKAILLNAAGMRMSRTLPEVDPLNFLPRVYQPTLVMNGRYDCLNPVETSQLPMFNLLGAPEKDKKLLLYDSGHGAPGLDIKRESLIWFDKYLGAVKK